MVVFLSPPPNIYFQRGERREEEGERNINVWLSLAQPLLGTWPATQARALTRNRTSDPLVCRPALNPLSHTSQGSVSSFYFYKYWITFAWIKNIKILKEYNFHVMEWDSNLWKLEIIKLMLSNSSMILFTLSFRLIILFRPCHRYLFLHIFSAFPFRL